MWFTSDDKINVYTCIYIWYILDTSYQGVIEFYYSLIIPYLHNISGGPKKVAQLLVGYNFKVAHKNSTKLHTPFFQHVFNHFVNFHSKWTTNVEMTVALKLGVQKSNIVDTSNIGCVLHALLLQNIEFQ